MLQYSNMHCQSTSMKFKIVIEQGTNSNRPVATGAFWGRAPPLKLSAPPLEIQK